jgi:hypothetical protein
MPRRGNDRTERRSSRDHYSHYFVRHPAKEKGIGLGDVFHRVTMRGFVRDHFTMIAAPVQCDVDGIPKRSRDVSVSPI